MKILCIVSRLQRPSTKYRLLQYVPYLKEEGIETVIRILPSWFGRWRLFAKAGSYDAVFIQKKLFSRLQLLYLRTRAKKIIYDFDDAIMYSKSKYKENTRRFKRFKSMVKAADHIIAGNVYLFGKSDPKKAEVIPTVLDVSGFHLHKRTDAGITIGWIGTKSTQEYLNVFEELFDRVEKMFPRVTIKIVSDEKPKLFGESIKWEKWEEKKELEQLLSFDIGIMPLVSNPWTMGKCGFKIIQYMAAGIPVICSPVGTNIEIIKNGDNGFCADNIPQWQEAISKLISDVHLYKAMSIAGRQTVEKYYNLSSWGPHFAKQIKKCIECHSPLSSLLGGEKG